MVRALLAAVLPAQSSLGFGVGPARTLLAATYVDNLIVFGRDATRVEGVLAWAQGWLREQRAVKLADSSPEVLVPVGAEVVPTRLARVWRSVSFWGIGYRRTDQTRGASIRLSAPCATRGCRFTPYGGFWSLAFSRPWRTAGRRGHPHLMWWRRWTVCKGGRWRKRLVRGRGPRKTPWCI